ncbi:MAG: hypothetical protein AB7D34_01300 [Sulfurimonas sp.]
MNSNTLKELKALFAKEHIVAIGYISGMKYFLKKTGEEMSSEEFIQISGGNYFMLSQELDEFELDDVECVVQECECSEDEAKNIIAAARAEQISKQNRELHICVR